ncbi:MAG TPA: uroporphyrinogen decarboxylase family protein [Bryobacteraceae bacterium]|nr:uroporphyrinogen decarboxylase family protein [Bryobacteraceae bacterium]
MHSRRQFFLGAAIPMMAPAASITPRQRVDRAIAGQDTDRFAYSCWYHFSDEKEPAKVHAANTLNFHRKFRTDLVKVMSDYGYPRSQAKWYELRVESNPFPEQIRALELIRNGLQGEAHFVETIFNPWTVAENLSSKEEVLRLKKENPQALLDALGVIARSEASHAKRAVASGASGVFLAIANAQEGVLTPEEYSKFSEPFDRMVLDAVNSAPLNTLHIHGEKIYLSRFAKGWPATAIHYSSHASGIPIRQLRQEYAGVIAGGIDERNFRTLVHTQMKRQVAFHEAGKKYIVAPGCSIPNDTKDEEILRFAQMIGA